MWQFIVQMIAQKKAQNQAFVADAQKAASAQQAGAAADPPEKQGQISGAKDSIGGALGSMMGGSAPGGSNPSSGPSSGAAELEQPGSNIGGLSAATATAQEPSSQQIDVFGGQEFGGKATAAAAKAAENPGVADYLQNAMGNYARNKVGKKISGRMDAAADFANAFGDENKTAAGGKIQDISDWFAGSDRKTRDEKRRKQGLYAY